MARVFIRFVLVPAVLSPVALPWLVCAGAYAGARLVSQLAGQWIDCVVFTAELLKQQRQNIEALAAWTCSQLGRVCVQYGTWLVGVHQQVEHALMLAGGAVQPVLQEAMYRSPALARLLSPALFLGSHASHAFDSLYNFVHDEIVPVALDLAERIPLVHDLLLRHVIHPASC